MPRRKSAALPAPPATMAHLTLADVATAAGRSPREVAQAAVQRALPLFVQGEGWTVAWNALIANGTILNQSELQHDWHGLAVVDGVSAEQRWDRETVTVAQVIDDDRAAGVLGCLAVVRTERQPDGAPMHVLQPCARMVPIAALRVRHTDGIALVKEIARDVGNLSYKKRHDTALRLLGVLLLMQEESRLKVPRTGTRPGRLVELKTATGGRAKLQFSNKHALAKLVTEFMETHGLGDLSEARGEVHGLGYDNLEAYFEAARDALNRSQDGLGDFGPDHEDA